GQRRDFGGQVFQEGFLQEARPSDVASLLPRFNGNVRHKLLSIEKVVDLRGDRPPLFGMRTEPHSTQAKSVSLSDDLGAALDVVINGDVFVSEELEIEILELLLGVARERGVTRWQQAVAEQIKSLGHAGIGARQVDVGADRHGALDHVELELGFRRDQDTGKISLSLKHGRICAFRKLGEVEAVATAGQLIANAECRQTFIVFARDAACNLQVASKPVAVDVGGGS